MKYLKVMPIITVLIFLTFTSANAGIVWEDYGFNYAVEQNGSNIYTSPNFTTPVTVTDQNLPKASSKQLGESGPSIDSSVNSTSAADTTPLGLQLKAGAGGNDLTNDGGIKNGVEVNAYTEISTAQGGISAPYGVSPDGTLTQEVMSYSVSRFHLTSAGTYDLSAQLTDGIINNASDLFLPPPPGGIPAMLDYNWVGGVTLYEYTENSVGSILGLSIKEYISLEELLDSENPINKPVDLKTEDNDGNSMFYDLKVLISLDSSVVNFDVVSEKWGANIPADALGSIGTEANPLNIEATLTAPVPIPGTAVLLISGIAGIIGFRNRRRG